MGEDGGGEVLGRDFVLEDGVPLAISGTNHSAVPQAAAGHDHRHHVQPVVATRFAVDDGSTPELAHHQNERLVKDPALLQVHHEG